MNGQSACRACGAPILWKRDARNYHKLSLDLEASDQGTVLVRGDYFYIVSQRERKEKYKGELHTKHASTCPSAAQWKRVKRLSVWKAAIQDSLTEK